MKKLIVGISLITFVLFVYTANASNVRQDKPKSVVTAPAKAAKTDAKCCPGTKKANAKCCPGDKKMDAKTCKGDTKTAKTAVKTDAKCDPGKAAGCSKKCTGAK